MEGSGEEPHLRETRLTSSASYGKTGVSAWILEEFGTRFLGTVLVYDCCGLCEHMCSRTGTSLELHSTVLDVTSSGFRFGTVRGTTAECLLQ